MAFGQSYVIITARVTIISLTWPSLLDDLKFKLIEIGLTWGLNPFWVWWMDKLDWNESKVNCLWIFITLETNVLLTLRVICGLKVLLWEAGWPGVEELELKPSQPLTVVRLWLGLSLAIKIVSTTSFWMLF